jgi:hypothetical protein
MQSEKRSENHELASNSLAEELRPIFDDFVAHDNFARTRRRGASFVSHIIFAEMVRAGWRLPADPIRDSAASDQA